MLTQTQVKLTALFAVVQRTVQTHYLDRFTASNPEYLSENETISIKNLNDFLVSAAIIERGSEIPYIKVNGTDTTTVTPDIIGAAYPLKAILPTSTVTMINGQQVSEQEFEEDRLLLKLKNAITKTKEQAAANIFLTGKYTQPNSGTIIDYNFETAEEVDAKTIENWVVFFFDIVDKYEEENGVYPDRIELGKDLFDKLIKNNEFIEIAKAYSNSIGLSADKKNVFLDILGQRIFKLKNAKTFDNKDIKVDDHIYLSNDNALVAGYAALEAVDNTNKPFALRGTEIIDKTDANKETARAKMFGKTGFTPIVAIKSFIKRYKVKNISAITTTSNVISELEAVANYYLSMDVVGMTQAISQIEDTKLLNLMLAKETRKNGQKAIEDRLGAL